MVVRAWERERKRMLSCNGADRGRVAYWDDRASPETEPTSRRC